jgi:basic amino acid/polyamine antiporter, APA family
MSKAGSKNDSVKGDTGLKKHLGVVAATLMGIGVILGAGIYVIVGVAAGWAGNTVWLSFLIAAVAAGLAGISYARLGRLRPKNAPEYQYLNIAFGRIPGFLAGWMVLWATVISTSAVALGFAGYLEHLFGIPIVAGTIGIVLFASIVVFIGIGESVIMAGILTAVEVLGLIIIIVIGVPHLGNVNLIEMPMGIKGVITAASLVFFAYIGFEGMANLSEEMKNPRRDLPKAIVFALGISTILYILVALAAVSVVGWKELSESSAPLAVVAAKALGTNANILLTAIALASTANTVIILMVSASRAMWSMSCEGVFPRFLCVLGKTRRTPWATILVVCIVTTFFAVIGNIETVAEFTNFAVLLAFAGVHASLIKIYGFSNHVQLTVKNFLLNIMIPGLGLIVALYLAVSTGLQAALFSGILLGIGLITYYILYFTARH